MNHTIIYGNGSAAEENNKTVFYFIDKLCI